MSSTPQNKAQAPNSKADAVRKDAEGQFARQKHATNPEGLHSANPVVTSKNGDATQPLDRPDTSNDRPDKSKMSADR